MQVANPFDLWSRATRQPLAASFAISLCFHLLLFGTYKLMPSAFLAGRGSLARFLEAITASPQAEQKRLDKLKQLANQKLFEAILREQQQEIPMAFVEVDPALASEPPKEAKFLSTHSTVAANPNPQKETTQPKIEGQETRMVRLFENPKPQPKVNPMPLQPSPRPKEPEPPSPPSPPKPKEEPAPVVKQETKPDTKSEPAKPLENIAPKTFEKAPDKPDLKTPGGETIGDVAMAKPKPVELPNKAPGSGAPANANPLITEPSPPPAHVRPRTLAQAYQQNPMLAGKLTKQEGGVRRAGRVSLDVKGSPFGAYDAAFIAAVQERWYQLLEKNPYMLDRRGKVVLDFRLRFDGRITDMNVADNDVGELLSLLCQRAVLDPAPYARWPGDMRRMVGADFREVRFTFYYD
jgi:hypothetical protein